MKEDVKQLACYLCDIERTSPPLVVEWHLRDKYDVSLEAFESLTGALVSLAHIGKENFLSNNVLRGFATREKGQNGRWLMKEVLRAKERTTEL